VDTDTGLETEIDTARLTDVSGEQNWNSGCIEEAGEIIIFLNGRQSEWGGGGGSRDNKIRGTASHNSSRHTASYHLKIHQRLWQG
jgi:hypothetical protein